MKIFSEINNTQEDKNKKIKSLESLWNNFDYKTTSSSKEAAFAGENINFPDYFPMDGEGQGKGTFFLMEYKFSRKKKKKLTGNK